MHRFRLVVPFLNNRSAHRLLCVCRSSKAELGPNRELALAASSEARLAVFEKADILDRIVGLDCADFPDDDADHLVRFLSLRRLKNMRTLQMPQFVCNLRPTVQFPASLTALTVELGQTSVACLGQLPRLVSLELCRTLDLDLALLSKVCPGLTCLDLDAVTSDFCHGELGGLDFLKTLRVENWDTHVPLTVLHLSIGARSVFQNQVKRPSNLEGIAKTLVTLRCSFTWPGIEEWPRLEKLKFDDCVSSLSWHVKDAPALRSFECLSNSTFATDLANFRLRALCVPANQLLRLVTRPPEIEHLRLTYFDQSRVSLAEFTGLRSLELHDAHLNALDITLPSLVAFTFVNGEWPHEEANFQFLKCPNLRRLRIEMQLSRWYSTPIPILPKLETIECDFFHETMFQSQVRHLCITDSDPNLSNIAILDALENCRRLETLHVPLRQGLDALIHEQFPTLVVRKTARLDPERNP